MKPSTYPPFGFRCTVAVQLSENKSYTPDISIKVAFYIQHWGDIHPAAKREAIWKLERLGVDKDMLKDADFETSEYEYTAIEPKGIKRDGTPIEAFYHCDPKKREQLIRQRRLVPDSYEDMHAMYGKPAKTTTDGVFA